MKKSDFIEKAIAIHGDKYDYSKVEYINYNDNIEARIDEIIEKYKGATITSEPINIDKK